MSVIAALRERAKYIINESIIDNPVVGRDLRTRMRGKQAFTLMGSYVLFLILVMTIAYYTAWSSASSQPYGGNSLVNLELGGTLFKTLAWTQTVLLALIIPSLTSGSLTLEIEKRTIGLLALTRLTPGKIVIGKHLAGILYPFVLMICSLPLSGICVMLGGISPAEIGITYLLLAAWAFLFAAVGLFWSSMFKKTSTASLLAYGTCGFYFLFTSYFVMMLTFGGYRGGSSPFISLNPGMAVTFGVLEVSTVCGIKVMTAMAAIVLHMLIGTLLITVASTHVKYFKVERALPIRLLLMTITAVWIWLYAGKANIWASGSGTKLDGLFYPMLMILIYLGFFAAIMATGFPRVNGEQIGLFYGISPRKSFRSDLAGSPMFMLIWSVFSYIVLGLTLTWGTLISGTNEFTKNIGLYIAASVSSIAVIWGISSLGVMFSSVIKKRTSAAAVMALLMLLVLVGYNLILMVYSAMSSTSGNPVWQLAAFWPITPLQTLSNNRWNGMPDLWWAKNSSWIVCTVLYSMIALAAMRIASKSAAKNTAVEEE
ncbi:MAG: ABC transporter permease [Armatimonadota bacterium]